MAARQLSLALELTATDSGLTAEVGNATRAVGTLASTAKGAGEAVDGLAGAGDLATAAKGATATAKAVAAIDRAADEAARSLRAIDGGQTALADVAAGTRAVNAGLTGVGATASALPATLQTAGAGGSAALARVTDAANQASRSLKAIDGGAGRTLASTAAEAAALSDGLRRGETATLRAAVALRAAGNAGREGAAGINAADAGLGGLAGRLPSVTRGLEGLAVYLAAGRLIDWGKSSLEAAAAATQLERRLATLTGGGAALADNQEWLAKTARDLGVVMPELASSYARLLVLQQAGLVTTGQARDLTLGLRDAMVHFGASTNEMGNVMYGLGQALASPVLHAEELAQVTEPLPGLLLALDKAAAQPAGGFRKMTMDGRVSAQMFRDVLIKALKDFKGEAEAAANGYEGSLGRMAEGWRRVKEEMGKEITPDATAFANWLTKTTDIAVEINKKKQIISAREAQMEAAATWNATVAARDDAEGYLEDRRQQLAAKLASSSALVRGAAAHELAGLKQAVDEANADLDAATRKSNDADRALAKLQGTAEDTWSAVWGAEWNSRQTAANENFKQAEQKLAALAEAAGLVRTPLGYVAADQQKLATATEQANFLLSQSPDVLAKLGIKAEDVRRVIGDLAEAWDPVLGKIAELNRETDALRLDKPGRDLYEALAEAKRKKPSMTDEDANGLIQSWLDNRDARGGEQVQAAKDAADAAEALAKAQASGNPVAIAHARAQKSVTDAIAAGFPAWMRSSLLKQADRQEMAAVTGQAGAATAQLTQQARAALSLAAAWGGAVDGSRSYVDAQAEAILADARASAAADHLTSVRDHVLETGTKLLASTTQSVAAMRNEAAGNRLIADATKDGIAARAEMERHVEVAQTQSQLLAAARAAEKVGDDELAKSLRALSAEYDQVSKEAAQAKQLSAGAGAILTSKQDLEYAKAELSLIGETAEARARALASLKIQQQAMALFKDTSTDALRQQRDDWVRLQEQIADTQALSAYQAKVEQTADEIAGDVSGLLWDQLTDPDKATSALDFFKNWGKRLATEFLKQQLILPITTQIVGALPSAFGIQGGAASGATTGLAGSSGAGGAGLDLSSLSRLTSSSSLPSWWGQDVLGGWSAGYTNAGVPPGSAGAGATVSSGSQVGVSWGQVATGAGAALSAFNAFNAFSQGKIGSGIGNTISAGLGIASLAGIGLGALGPIGMIAAPILGGLLDDVFKGKPSNKEGRANLDLATGRTDIGGQDGKKYSQENRDAAVSLAQRLRQIAQALGGFEGVTIQGSINTGVGDRDGIYAGGLDREVRYFERSDAGIASLTDYMVEAMADRASAALPAQYARAIKDLDWSDVNAALADIQFLQQIANASSALDGLDTSLAGVEAAARKSAKATYDQALEEAKKADALGVGSDYRDLVTKQMRAGLDGAAVSYTSVETAVAQLKGQTEAAVAAIKTLGLALGEAEVRASAAAQMEKMRADLTASLDQAINSATGRDYLNQIAAAEDARATTLRDLAAVGGDTQKAWDLYNAQVKSILQQLDATQMAEVVGQYGQALADLRGTVTAEAQSVRAWLDSQVIGDTSTLAPVDRIAEAQRQMQTAMGGSDTNAVLQLADTLARLSREAYGGSAEGAALTGWTRSSVEAYARRLGIPGFADGGDFAGGWRLVGERGPELEAVGPARYWSAAQTQRILTPPPAANAPAASGEGLTRADAREMVRVMTMMLEEMRALRADGAVAADQTARLTRHLSALRNMVA
jgi:tape measure domain-containing protein